MSNFVPSTLNIVNSSELDVRIAADLRVDIERGRDTKELWTMLHQLVVNDSTRNAVLSEIFSPRDTVMSAALVRESDLPTRRERYKFFRDVAWRRHTDDACLRQRIKDQLVEPLYDAIVDLQPVAQHGDIAHHAAAAIDNLLFDADPAEIDSHRWSSMLAAAEAWWRALGSTALFRVLARILQAKDNVSDDDASVIGELLRRPLANPSQSDTKAVARIGVGFAKLARKDTLLSECGSWLERRSATMAASPCSPNAAHAEFTSTHNDSEIKLFSMLGMYSLKKAGKGEMDAYSIQLQQAARVMYGLKPEDRFAELYIMKVNPQSVWAFQTFLEKVDSPQGFARTFWLGSHAVLPEDNAAIAFVVSLARLGIRPDVACGLLADEDPYIIELLVNHDGAEHVALTLVSNNLSRLDDVLVDATVQRLQGMVSECAHLDLESAYAAMVDNESRREAEASDRAGVFQVPAIDDRGAIIARLAGHRKDHFEKLSRSTVQFRWFQFDANQYYRHMAEAIAELRGGGVDPSAVWVHGTLRHHVANIVVNGINIRKSNQYTDFGQAFYLTDAVHVVEAAKQAAQVAQKAPLGDMLLPDCAIIVFHVGQDVLERFNHAKFPLETSPEWKECVKLCRARNLGKRSLLRRDALKEYDSIYGPVAVTRPGGSWDDAVPMRTRGVVVPQLAVKSRKLARTFAGAIASVWIFGRVQSLASRVSQE
jgi:hypothetical protein